MAMEQVTFEFPHEKEEVIEVEAAGGKALGVQQARL
jgi:hypothetical protein